MICGQKESAATSRSLRLPMRKAKRRPLHQTELLVEAEGVVIVGLLLDRPVLNDEHGGPIEGEGLVGRLGPVRPGAAVRAAEGPLEGNLVSGEG